jgi:hypothetical protein
VFNSILHPAFGHTKKGSSPRIGHIVNDIYFDHINDIRSHDLYNLKHWHD